MLTKKGKSRCATPLRALFYQATLAIKAQEGLGGKKRKERGGSSKTRRCGMLTKRGK